MFELAMTSSLRHLTPAVLLQKAEDIGDLHVARKACERECPCKIRGKAPFKSEVPAAMTNLTVAECSGLLQIALGRRKKFDRHPGNLARRRLITSSSATVARALESNSASLASASLSQFGRVPGRGVRAPL